MTNLCNEKDNKIKGKKAQVHCAIIGFSYYFNRKKKKILDSKGHQKNVVNINPYLKNAPNIVVKTRSHPICDAPEMNKGSQPTDGGFLLLNESEKEKLIQENSLCKKWIRPFMGAKEFLNGEKRWCLWLVNAKPNELRKCKLVLKRIDSVRKLRLKSKAASTRKASNIASLFTGIRQPNSKYLIFPEISSEKRQYVPIKFAKKNIISSNKLQLIPNATLYDFGILESIVHMAWMRAVCGRLEMRYIYSNSIVYNNFIWPKPTPEQKAKIEKCAQAVLDARKLYPDSTLADLYDPNTMPPELVKAHENLDKAVKDAYGNKGFETEEEIVSSLMKLYKKAIDKENKKRGL